MGSTADWSIPYTEPTDHVAEYPAVSQAGAERVDAILTGSEVSFTYASGWGPHEDFPLRIFRKAGLLYFIGGIFNTTSVGSITAWARYTFATIDDVSARPLGSSLFLIPCIYTVSSSIYISQLYINGAGTMQWTGNQAKTTATAAGQLGVRATGVVVDPNPS